MYQVPLDTYEALTRVQRGQGLFSCTLFARTGESVWAFLERNRQAAFVIGKNIAD